MSNEEMFALIISKLEKLEQGQIKLEQGQIKLEQRQSELEAELKSKASREEMMLDFNTIIEHKVSKEIRLIAEQHGDIIARLPDVEELSELKGRVCVLERVVTDLSADVDKLKKAQ